MEKKSDQSPVQTKYGRSRKPVIITQLITCLGLGNEPLFDGLGGQVFHADARENFSGASLLSLKNYQNYLAKYVGGSAASRSKAGLPPRTLCEDRLAMSELDGQLVNNPEYNFEVLGRSYSRRDSLS